MRVLILVGAFVLLAFTGTSFLRDAANVKSVAGVPVPRLRYFLKDGSDCVGAAGTVRVRLSRSRYPEITDHVEDVRGDYPARLHKVDKEQAAKNRKASLRDDLLWSELTVAQKKKADRRHWTEPHDRDEYPPAMSREGGAKADIRYVLSSENRSAGSVMGSRLREYCDGQTFRIVVVHAK